MTTPFELKTQQGVDLELPFEHGMALLNVLNLFPTETLIDLGVPVNVAAAVRSVFHVLEDYFDNQLGVDEWIDPTIPGNWLDEGEEVDDGEEDEEGGVSVED